MGLDISGYHSGEHISWGYQGIHNIRMLAYAYCGISYETAWLCMKHPDLDMLDPRTSILMKDKELKPSDLFKFSAAGYHFSNLLFHSDCEGVYTLKGKAYKDSTLLQGNIEGLYKELKMLKNDDIANNEDYKKDYIKNMERYEYSLDRLNKFYHLVDQEMKHPNPLIIFS